MENELENEIPYNPNNLNLINASDVEEVLSKYNIKYKVQNIGLFREAFTHKSYIFRNCWSKEQLEEKRKSFSEPIIELQPKSYEELEFFGDTVLDFVTVNYITTRFQNQTEGFYTKLKSKIVSGSSISKIAKNLSFHKFVLISDSVEEKSGRHSEKILEDVFEAFIGALFKDSVRDNLKGFDTCYSFLWNMLDNVNYDFDYARLQLYDSNYKDQILKHYHQNKWGYPQYVEISVEDNLNTKIFTIGLVNPQHGVEKYLAEGVGNTKKKAEQHASKNALKKLGLLYGEF